MPVILRQSFIFTGRDPSYNGNGGDYDLGRILVTLWLSYCDGNLLTGNLLRRNLLTGNLCVYAYVRFVCYHFVIKSLSFCYLIGLTLEGSGC